MERWVREGEGEEDGKQKRKGRKRMGEYSEPSQNGNPRYATTAYNDEKRFEDNFIHRKQTIEHTINQI